MKKLLENHKIRFLLRTSIAVLIAFLVSYYFYHKALGLMLFSTLFVMLTSTGSAFFQGLLRFFLLIFLVIAVHFIVPKMVYFYNHMDVILFGSFIGILTNVLIFPDKINLEFKRAVTPFLKDSCEYFSAIISYLNDNNPDRMHHMDQAKIHLQNKLLLLPIWVYQPGFDLALQKGYRYYFMQLNHLAEILFAMHYLTRFNYDKTWMKSIEDSLSNCDHSMTEFVTAIMTLLDMKKLQEGVIDFEEDINNIEAIFNKLVPVPPELLETYSNAKYLAEFIHYVRELRVVLIQLAKALR